MILNDVENNIMINLIDVIKLIDSELKTKVNI